MAAGSGDSMALSLGLARAAGAATPNKADIWPEVFDSKATSAVYYWLALVIQQATDVTGQAYGSGRKP